MSATPNLTKVRDAKREIASTYSAEPWYRGVGISPAPGGGYLVRINVDRSCLEETKRIPKTIHGIRVKIVGIAGYSPRK
jgi:hypothetical protein